MRISKTPPVDLPRDFKIDEMFFSTTNEKGIIQSGNAVFARVSGYTLEELVGQPHNTIRHPDMPRVVFRLLWDYLSKKLPVVALVKNMAKDGRYYWVIALVTPVPGGHLSVRFKPSAPISTQVQELYARLLAVEAKHTAEGADGRASMDAAQQELQTALAALGFANYDSFMWKYLHDEMKSRDRLVGEVRGAGSKIGVGRSSQIGAALRSIYEGARRAYQEINSLYAWLDELTALHDRLMERSGQAFDLTQNIRFVALSTTIKAARLGDEGRSLGTIAQYLSDASARTAEQVQGMTHHLRDVSTELHGVIFNLASARLQLEMMLFFVGELLEGETTDIPVAEVGASRETMIRSLQKAFHATTGCAVHSLATFGKHLTGLNSAADDLRRTILTLRVAQIGGKVEASRIKNDDSIMALLTEIQGYIDSTVGELDGIGEITDRFTALIRSVPSIARSIDDTVERIEKDMVKLSAEAVEPVSTAPRAATAGDAPLAPTSSGLLHRGRVKTEAALVA